ncbi:MAG: hypothetical protein BWK76_28435 [Desulfobulbaceae bacterium A2]|nr:MAG: hypothetical protein BWK76_28435 [Desulfobulbaceae bacterium A2]
MKTKSSFTIGIVAAAVLLIVGGAWGLAAKTSKDNFCITCHAYEKVSWDHGQHPDVGCIACHTKGVVKDKTAGLRKVYLTLTDQVNPHRDNLPSYKEKIQQNCVGCHMSSEQLALAPAFKARHEEYRQRTENCMQCHEAGHAQPLKNLRKPTARYRS